MQVELHAKTRQTTRASGAAQSAATAHNEQKRKLDTWPSGSTPSATARPKAAPRCATCSAARARTSPRWPISACRCRPASPSRPRSAPTSTPTSKTYPKELERAGRRTRSRRSARITGTTSATPNDPLLVSVRSGARASMPGMMDTVLNLGLNDVTVEALAQDRPATGASPTTAIAASSRCIPTSCSASATTTSRRSSRRTRTRTATRSTPISSADDWAELVKRYKTRVKEETGEDFPQDPQQAAVGRDRRGVRLVDERARHHLSPPAQHPGELGHRGQRAGDGVRQHGRRPRPPASPSRAIPRPARRRSTASS